MRLKCPEHFLKNYRIVILIYEDNLDYCRRIHIIPVWLDEYGSLNHRQPVGIMPLISCRGRVRKNH
jgi:hypothetical protein